MPLHSRRLFQAIGAAWYLCAILYGLNFFVFEWIAEPWATASLLLVAAACLALQAIVARKENQRSAAQQRLADAQEGARRKRAVAVGQLWQNQLMKLSVDYLQRQDEQTALGRAWRENGPTVQLMHQALALRMQSLADAAHAERMQDLAQSSIEEPEPHLVQLSLMIQHGCMVMSLWAPGDEFMPMMPTMDELAPLTVKLN